MTLLLPGYRARNVAAMGAGSALAGIPAPTTFWRLEDLTDSVGSRTLTASGSAPTNGAAKIGNGYTYASASSQYHETADHADLRGGSGVAFTVCAWVKHTTLGAPFVTKWAAGGAQEWDLTATSNLGRFEFKDQFSGSKAQNATTFGAMSTATWYFLVGWFDPVAQQLGISVNDVANTLGVSTSYIASGSNPVRLASFSNGIAFHNGQLDAVGIWRGTALTTAQRTALYNSGAGAEYYASAWH